VIQQGQTNGETTPARKVTEAYRPGQADRAHRVHHRPSLTLNDIRDRALAKWVAAGRPPGDNLSFWLEAETELLQGS
jgi:hypothetical protein